MKVRGESTDARVFLDEDEIEELTLEQIQEMVDHEAFTNRVRVMPDTHPGAGCVIGFTMSLGDRVVPNVVGVDIGCGMYASEINNPEGWSHAEVDKAIRDSVPLGYESHSNQQYHFGNDFPWERANQEAEKILESESYYDLDYFKRLCERGGTDINKAINQMGSLGGGNHFIEVSESKETGNTWLVLHSGSRALGNGVARYWQERATESRNRNAVDSLSQDEIPDEIEDVGGVVDDFVDYSDGSIDMQKAANFCRRNFEAEEIEANLNRIRQVRYDRQQDKEENRNTDLDYLDGDLKEGYLRDMVFCQQYALENRRYMVELIVDALGVEIHDRISSPHNLVDTKDGIIRKGATRAMDGERLIIPYTMSDGAIIARGKGNDEWNQSAPHGAGRRGSRTWAKDEFTIEEYEEDMEGIYSSSVNESTLDEYSKAYKSPDLIEGHISDTVEIVDRLNPIINVKADGY